MPEGHPLTTQLISKPLHRHHTTWVSIGTVVFSLHGLVSTQGCLVQFILHELSLFLLVLLMFQALGMTGFGFAFVVGFCGISRTSRQHVIAFRCTGKAQ